MLMMKFVPLTWTFLVFSLVPSHAYPNFDNEYCLTPWKSVHFSYSAAAGPVNEVYPESCWNRCLAQKPDLQVIAFTKTRTDELICFCPNSPAAEYLVEVIDPIYCENCTSPTGETFTCGSKRGLLGVLSRVAPSPVLSGLRMVLKDENDNPVLNEFTTETLIHLEITFNDGPVVTCNLVNGCDHPIELKINFGDGSGDLVYNYVLGETTDLWSHVYTYPGEFMVAVIAKNILTSRIESVYQSIKIYEDIFDPPNVPQDVELSCPHLLRPGQYFQCWVFLRIGTNLKINLKMVDDISGRVDVNTIAMHVPDYWFDVPGQVFPHRAYNDSTQVTSGTSFFYAFPSTAFKALANVSKIEIAVKTPGLLKFSIARPICPSGTVWCSMNMICETQCADTYQTSPEPLTCPAEEQNDVCSLEGSCRNHLSCPLKDSVKKDPTGYAELWSFEMDINPSTTGKVVLPITKATFIDPKRAGNEYLLRNDTAFPRGSILVAQCPDPTNCPQIYFRTPKSFEIPDIPVVSVSAGIFKLGQVANPKRQHAIRIFTVENRHLRVEQRFFCDKPTEKTVTLNVITHDGDALSPISTPTISCQYPIMEIYDLSLENPNNDPLTPFKVIKPLPTKEEILSRVTPNRTDYLAEMWLVTDQPFTWDVKFGSGSHVIVNWTETQQGEICSVTGEAITPAPGGGITVNTVSSTPCVFPFRYDHEDKILHYGCTNTSALSGKPICATSVDLDNVATEVGICNNVCHVQNERLIEVDEAPLNVSKFQEGNTVFQNDYRLPVETTISLLRVFSSPGMIYNLELHAQNNLVPEDQAHLTWSVICANPINPDDWEIDYEPFVRPENSFKLTLSIQPNKPLPTRPVLKFFPIKGRQVLNNNVKIDKQNPLTFFLANSSVDDPDCSIPNQKRCVTELEFLDLGVSPNDNSGPSGLTIEIGLIFESSEVSQGFSVEFRNPISSIKYHHETQLTATEVISVLDEGPLSSGEWVDVTVVKWDVNFVETYTPIEEPLSYKLRYTLPDLYGANQFNCDFVEDRFYLPASAYPSFDIGSFGGDVRRVQYSMENVDPAGYHPPPCFMDWPKEVLPNTWRINHCPNITEGTYTLKLSLFNPLDGWMDTDDILIEVLSQCGPITIDDWGVITDAGEPRNFEVKLEYAGQRTCVSVDWGDGEPLALYGNLLSCKIRYPTLTPSDVGYFNHVTKVIKETRVYKQRGLFSVNATAFDIRHFVEKSLPITVFKMPCTAPRIWIPLNHTSIDKVNMIPRKLKADDFEFHAVSNIKCTKPTPTYMSWRLYQAYFIPDESSQIGVKEDLVEIPLRDTNPSWNLSVLVVPGLTYDVGVYKAVFRLDIETYDPEIPVFGEAFTYFQIVPSPLVPIIITGSASKVSRGWGQILQLNPRSFSIDPDAPQDKNFTYEWFCRSVLPTPEEYPFVDDNGWPIYVESQAQVIRSPGRPKAIKPPPGCFGLGPGPLKTGSGRINFNTSSFITFSRTFEFTLILSKDTRKAITTLRVEVTSFPPPITTLACLSQEQMCFPSFKGLFVNPTKRLALVGDCVDLCEGDLTYFWSVHEITPLGGYKKLVYSQCSPGITLPTTSLTTVTAPTTTVTTAAPFVRSIASVITTLGSKKYASSNFEDDSSDLKIVTSQMSVSDLFPEPTGPSSNKRRKRQTLLPQDIEQIGPDLPNGCEYVFGNGRSDSRTTEDLAIRELFFELNPGLKNFRITFNVTKTVNNGQREISSSGSSYLEIIVNQPPVNGTCELLVLTTNENNEEEWIPASSARSLKDVLRVICSGWVDPDGHSITKFVFKAQKIDSEDPPLFLYAGPRSDLMFVLAVGEFTLEADIHESGGTYATTIIDEKFNSYIPNEEDYRSMDVQAEISLYQSVGDGARVAQILSADASIKQLAKYFDPEQKINTLGKEVNGTNGIEKVYSESDVAQIEQLLKDLALSNANALTAATNALSYKTLDELNQGAGLLFSITGGINKNDMTAKTMDTKGREAALEMFKKMNIGFEHLTSTKTVDNPNDFKAFLEGTSGSAMSLIENLNKIIFAEDFDSIPPSDMEAALDMPYDTDIGEGRDADIPDDPNDAMRFNVMKLTKATAKKNVNEMLDLLNQAGKTVVMNSVQGEELKTSSPKGIKMIMTRIPWSKTIGRDSNGDGWPDIPLRFEFEDSNSVIQFPLGYCPGDRKNVSDPQINFRCIGEWGFVLKEWETITKVYPKSSKNLNPVTKQLDIDVYDPDGNLVDVSDMEHWIEFIIGRMRRKNPEAVQIPVSARANVNIANRIASLDRRQKPYIIYHELNVSIEFASLNIQIKIDSTTGNDSNIVLLLRNAKMPLLNQCDFIKKVKTITLMDGEYRDWFIPLENVQNRTGKWYLGVLAVANEDALDALEDMAPCQDQKLTKDILSSDFKTTEYTIQTFTSGCYYLNEKTDEWESSGMTILNTSKLVSACGSNHLTSFATGFFPQINTIDFDFVFAHASFEDNLTIYLLVIICLIFYIIAMIWAILKDQKDTKALKVPLLKDNNPEHSYFYEIIVETGPLNSHATTSNVEFILSGEDDETDVRQFKDPDREIFKAGALDPFLMSTEFPLGELKYLRIWQDNTGLADNGAWYLLSVSVFDIQTGETTRFIADQWLAIDRGTYEDDITLHAIEDEEAANAYYLIKSAGNSKLSDDHIWWSVFSRPIRSRFSRCQRVSTCMAMLCLCMLANAMFYGTYPARVADPYFSLGLIGFDPIDVGIGFISNLIVFPPLILAVVLFKKSAPFKKRTSRFDLALEEAKDTGDFVPPSQTFKPVYKEEIARKWKAWPMVLHILAWVLVLVCILGGIFVVFSYGITFGNDKTYQWVVAMISSFFSSVLITQPIYIAILTGLISLCYQKSKVVDHTNTDENPPVIYWDPSKPSQKRPRKHKPKRRVLESEFLAQLTKRKLQEMEMKTIVRDLVIYFFYVLIIFIISYGNRDPSSFLEKESLEQSVVHGALNCEVLPEDDPNYQSCDPEDVPEPYIDFMKVRDVNEWWYWMDRTLQPNVRVQPWYNGRQPYGLKGYLNDRVNRLIGYAIVRQVREELGTCKPAKVIRDAVETCTGDGGLNVEDSRDYCAGWKQYEVGGDNKNCTEAEEFRYTSATELEAAPITAGINTYGGGGYVFRIKGFIGDVEEKIQMLKEQNWIDNRTRAVFVEFSVYNAQVNMFGIVTCVAEFIGGGVQPWFRVDAVRLFANVDGFGFVTTGAEILFVVAFFYYVINVIVVMKKEGCSKFFESTWNVIDLFTVILSLIALILYVVRMLITRDMTKRFDETKGNAYIRLSYASIVDEYYTYVVSFTVFTSTLKFCRLLSFQKAFMQVAATIRLCFQGLSTFFVEFSIVFGGFTSFFYFVLKNDLDNFRDFIRSLENTMAMSIGKFNFAELRAADEMAAWIFFIFSVVVNMILINMMMAIINLAFEEIKSNEADFQNRFELVDYLKRSVKELVGIQVAPPIVPVYQDEVDQHMDNEDVETDKVDEGSGDVSTDFTNKTDQLLRYIEDTYLSGFVSNGDNFMHKMKASDPDDKKIINYGFDALFKGNQKKED